MFELNVPNNLRHGRLTETIKLIVENVKAGELVSVQNSGDFAVSVVMAVECAKQRLKEEGIKIFQNNRLLQREVYLPEKEDEPLAKSKLHHNQVQFIIQLSISPIDPMEEGDTQQVLEPASFKKAKSSTKKSEKSA